MTYRVLNANRNTIWAKNLWYTFVVSVIFWCLAADVQAQNIADTLNTTLNFKIVLDGSSQNISVGMSWDTLILSTPDLKLLNKYMNDLKDISTGLEGVIAAGIRAQWTQIAETVKVELASGMSALKVESLKEINAQLELLRKEAQTELSEIAPLAKQYLELEICKDKSTIGFNVIASICLILLTTFAGIRTFGKKK